MAYPLSTLYFVGGLAALATLGLFINFDDKGTSVVVSYVAALLWGLFSLMSFDVRTITTYFATKSDSLSMLGYFTGVMSAAIFVFATWQLLEALGDRANDADISKLT